MKFFKEKVFNNKLIFSLLLIAYALKSADILFAGIDSVVLTWSLLLFFVYSNYNKKSVIISFVVYVVLTCFYLLGEMRVSNAYEGIGYIRILPTFFILTSIISVQLAETSVRGSNSIFKVESLMLLLIVYWIIFIAKAQTTVDYAVREYGASNYLTLSDIVALLGLSVIGDSQNKLILKILWLVAGLVAMMMLGSRASVLVFTLIALLSISTVSRNNIQKIKPKILLFVGFVISFFVYLFFNYFNDTVTYRMQTILDIGNDESIGGRNIFLSKYFSTISADPTCLIISCPPLMGNYAHNFFSIFQYFGFIGILLFICGAAFIGLAFLKGWRPWLATILMYSLIQLIFFRSWTSMVFPVVIAYVIAAAIFIFCTKRGFKGGED